MVRNPRLMVMPEEVLIGGVRYVPKINENKYPESGYGDDFIDTRYDDMSDPLIGKGKYALQTIIIHKDVPSDKAMETAKDISKKKKLMMREKEDTRHYRVLPPNRFIKKTFRSKKINPHITLTFGELKPEHEKLMGHGFFDYFKKGYDTAKQTFSGLKDTLATAKERAVDTLVSAKDKVVDTLATAKESAVEYLQPRLDDYPNSTKKMLDKYGDKTVTQAIIHRKPIDAYIPVVLNLVSLGKWNEAVKKVGYDKFFHLSLIVEVEGEMLNVEKLDVVSITEGVPSGKGVESQDVPLEGESFTLLELLETARKAVGDKAFFEYDSFQNNCQSFVSYLLKGQGLYGEEEEAFTYQPIQSIVDEMPDYVKKFQRGLTDISATLKKITGMGVVGNTHAPYGNLHDLQRQLGSGFLDGVYMEPIQPFGRPQDDKYRRQPYKGSGIEDIVKEKGMEVASAFADSLGGQDFFKGVGEDITDVFSGRRIGDTQRDRADAQRLASQARDREEREFIKNNPIEAEALQWAGERQTNLQQELFGQFQTKFPSEENPYGAQGYPYDAMNFSLVSQRKGFKTKPEVEKFYQKVKKDALQTLKKGSLAEAEKKYKEQEAKDQKLMGRGSGNPFIDLGKREMAKMGLGMSGGRYRGTDIADSPNDPRITFKGMYEKPFDPLEKLKEQGEDILRFYGLGKIEGGNQMAGFIRAMMASKSDDPETIQKGKEKLAKTNEARKEKGLPKLTLKQFNEARKIPAKIDVPVMAQSSGNVINTADEEEKRKKIKKFHEFVLQKIEGGLKAVKGLYPIEELYNEFQGKKEVDKKKAHAEVEKAGRTKRRGKPPREKQTEEQKAEKRREAQRKYYAKKKGVAPEEKKEEKEVEVKKKELQVKEPPRVTVPKRFRIPSSMVKTEKDKHNNALFTLGDRLSSFSKGGVYYKKEDIALGGEGDEEIVPIMLKALELEALKKEKNLDWIDDKDLKDKLLKFKVPKWVKEEKKKLSPRDKERLENPRYTGMGKSGCC
jgi:hypothetical protein